MGLLISSLSSVNVFKMKKEYALLQSEVIMGENLKMIGYNCYVKKNGILHNISTPRTHQQNGVVERKNKSLQEMARTMLNDNSTLSTSGLKR